MIRWGLWAGDNFPLYGLKEGRKWEILVIFLCNKVIKISFSVTCYKKCFALLLSDLHSSGSAPWTPTLTLQPFPLPPPILPWCHLCTCNGSQHVESLTISYHKTKTKLPYLTQIVKKIFHTSQKSTSKQQLQGTYQIVSLI